MNTLAAALLTASAFLPVDPFAHDSVDVIERNDVRDDIGDFRQVIFWRHDGDRDAVTDWRLDEGIPPAERTQNGWRLRWFDGNVLREVRASTHWHSQANYDRETEDQEITPQGERRRLSRVRR